MIGERRKIRLAKFLDDRVGPVLIFALRLFEALLGRPHKRFADQDPAPERVRKILFIKFWGMGSVVLSEPAVRHLNSKYSRASIHYLTLRRNRELFSLVAGVSKVHTLSFGSWTSLLTDSLRLVKTLRREQFDLVFDGEFFVNYSGLVARAVCGSVIGFSRTDGRKKMIQDVSVPFRDDRHAATQFLGLVSAGALSDDGFAKPKLALQGSETGPPSETTGWTIFGPAQRPYLVMNVNASPLAVERRWSGDNFVRLGRALLEAYNVDIVLTGSESESGYVGVVERGFDNMRVHNLCGELSLRGLASLLREAACLISNDSGPIHLASALDTPVVGFYGPETPLRYGPLSRRALVFHEDLWCSPCMSVDNAKTVHCVNDLACMKRIDPVFVIPRVKRFIEEHQLLNLRQKRPATARSAVDRRYA